MKDNYFNLIDEPWVPVADEGIISLRDLFGARKYRRLGGTPIQKIAVMKMLQAIAQAACTPKDASEWFALGEETLANRCLNYLLTVHHCFFLYGEKPFMQVPEIVGRSGTEKGSIGIAMVEFATGNTTIWRQSQVEHQLCDAEKALLLVTLMGFAVGGKGWGGKRWDPYKQKETPNALPGVSLGRGVMHSFCFGTTIQHSLWLNLFTQEHLDSMRLSQVLPPWEHMPKMLGDEREQELKESLTGRLAPLSRFCFLEKDEIHTTHGISYSPYDKGGFDPSVTLNIKKQAVACSPEKRPWRSLSAMLSFLGIQNESCFQIKIVVDRLSDIQLPYIEIWSGGLRISDQSGEQFVSGESDDFVDSSICISTDHLHQEWYSSFECELRALENVADYLEKQVVAYFKSLKSVDGRGHAKKALNLFWQLCEQKLMELVDVCGDRGEALQKIRREFAEYAKHVFNATCPKDTARQLEAWAKHRPYYTKYLNKGGRDDK